METAATTVAAWGRIAAAGGRETDEATWNSPSTASMCLGLTANPQLNADSRQCMQELYKTSYQSKYVDLNVH